MSSDSEDEAFDGNSLAGIADTANAKLNKLSGGGSKAGKGNGNKPSAVLYLGHVPHGFYEDQMNGFFSQFGAVSRLRLSRNKKTGKSKHYAFIEMESAEVAKVVAETMDKYFLSGQQLVCHILPPDKVHERMFAGAGRKFRPIPWRTVARKRHNAPKGEEQRAAQASRLSAKTAKKRKQMEELGIDYDFVGYGEAAAVAQPAPAKKAKKSKTPSKKKAAAVEEPPVPKSANKKPAKTPAATPKAKTPGGKAKAKSVKKAKAAKS